MNEPVVRRSVEAHSTRLWFHCPGCGQYHAPIVEGDNTKMPVWGWNGDLVRPTLTPSVRATWPHADGTRMCHFFLRLGELTFLSDCTHSRAGQTVPLSPWKD